jgi:hypothetical protein
VSVPVAVATRDPLVEFLRGGLMAVLLSPAMLSLPALRSLAMPGWTALLDLRLLDALFVFGLAVVAGAVFGQTARCQGLARCAGALLRRSATYYLAFVGVAAVVLLARLLPGVDTRPLTQWADPVTGLIGSTYPGPAERVSYQLFELIFLRAGPGQMQLLALSAVLLAAAPLLAWAMCRGRTAAALGVSAALALLGALGGLPDRPWLGLQFEQRYALWLWQLPFAVGFVVGWLRPVWMPRALGHPAAQLLGQRVWQPLRRGLGPALLPLGQQALAVFVLHGLWLLLFLQLPPLAPAGAAAALATSWLITWAIVGLRPVLRWLPH